MNIVDVIIPTMRKVHAFSCLERLRHIPWPYRLHVITGGRSWAEAINIGLKQTNPNSDVILMDDDVFIDKDTFSTLDDNYPFADIFGFKLLFPDKSIQHMGGIVRAGQIGHIGYAEEDRGQYKTPLFTCHATTSLIYIKRKVLNLIGGMSEDIPGIQMEDVDFSFRALKAGLKILVLPTSAIHLQSASKKSLPQFEENIAKAFAEVHKRHMEDQNFVTELQKFPIKKLEFSLA